MLVKENLVFVDVEANTQAAVFEEIVQKAFDADIIQEKEAVLASLKEREAMSTTGMMDGFAIPHAKTNAVVEPSVVVMKLTTGVEWNSLDGKPITTVVCLLIPETESGTTHLQALSTIARMLMRSEVKEAVNKATTAQELYRVFTVVNE